MNCPNCGAAMRLESDRDSFTCDYCQSIYLPEKNDDGVRVLTQADGMECPVCAGPLWHGAMESRRLLYCTRCRGLLIQMEVFVDLIESLHSQTGRHSTIPRPPDPKGLDRRLSCPQCHGPMDTHYYAGPGNIIIDDCSRCGWDWLDAGELAKVARAPDRFYPGDASEKDSGSDSR